MVLKLSDLRRLLAPLARRVDNMVARAVLKVVKDGPAMQAIQAEVLKGEVRDNVERFQEYGFTSVPLPGAEVVLVFANGDRSHGLAVAVDDRRYRKRNLQQGEVALYTDEGDFILLRRGRVIEIVAGDKVDVTAPNAVFNCSDSVTFNTPLAKFTGALEVDGKINGGSGLEVAGTFENNGKDVGSQHKHSDVQAGTDDTGEPI